MTKAASQLISAAMALPPKSKAQLAEQLLSSLDSARQKEIDAAWAEEGEDRINAFEAGKIDAISANSALRSKRRRK